MTIAVDLGRKATKTNKQTNQYNLPTRSWDIFQKRRQLERDLHQKQYVLASPLVVVGGGGGGGGDIIPLDEKGLH